MPVYDKRYEDQLIPSRYVHIVLKLVSPGDKREGKIFLPLFGEMELKNDQLGYLPVYLNYTDAVRDYPNTAIHQMSISTED